MMGTPEGPIISLDSLVGRRQRISGTGTKMRHSAHLFEPMLMMADAGGPMNLMPWSEVEDVSNFQAKVKVRRAYVLVAEIGELGVLGQKAVARMNALCGRGIEDNVATSNSKSGHLGAGGLGHLNDLVHAQVRLRGGCRANEVGLVRLG